MFDRLFTFIKALFNGLMGRIEDPSLMLEQTYQDLQSNLTQVRQAVAQAIATEKQLEQQWQKNREQAETWHNRAAMAVQQGNDELARQALQRKQQYVQATAELETQLKSQKEATTTLRQRLTDLESEVQKAYTKKAVLIARDKAAQAVGKANEILSKTTASGALSVMERMETKVLEREARAQALGEVAGDPLEKQFKNYEGRGDVEAELLALKGQLDPTKLVIKEPTLIEMRDKASDTVDAQDVKEVKND